MKPLAILLGALMLLALVPSTALAARVPCGDNNTENLVTGWDFNNTSDYHGVSSYIQPRGTTLDFGPCDKTPPGMWNNTNGALAWVAVVPAVGTPYYNSLTAIIQVGLLVCDPTASCYAGAGKMHYFIAGGGCGGAQPTVQVKLASQNFGNHKYWMEQDQTNGDWNLYVDSTKLATIGHNDPSTSCWSQDAVNPIYQPEQWDPGDSVGTGRGANRETLFTGMNYKTLSDTWVHMDAHTATCNVGILQISGCAMYTDANGLYDNMKVWNH